MPRSGNNLQLTGRSWRRGVTAKRPVNRLIG